MKKYKLNYKDANGKVLATLNLLSSSAIEAMKQCDVLLQHCLDIRVKSVDISK